MKKIVVIFFAFAVPAFMASAGEIKIKVEKQYLNIPISHNAGGTQMKISGKGIDEWPVNVMLADGQIDYWVFRDLSEYKGKTLTISFGGDDRKGLQQIYQDDRIAGADSLYKEINRPQVHFSSRVGWNNDPNGMVYYDGEYHLFYQHNPYSRNWDNMHWGHAVSRDLIHWQELNYALRPDSLGMIYSGSAVMDFNNTAGYNKKGEPAMLAYYTSAGAKQTQSMAYSTDKGRSWTKYDKNPVVDSHDKWNTVNTRDPKVFWYAPNNNWVMAFNERDGHSIYTSADGKEWKYESHTEGFWECPELFELAVDGDPANKKWIMYGASGTYMIGSFNGRKFTPEQGKFYYQKGNIYAAQTFNDAPDGRRIQIGWATIQHPGMRFNSMMSVPTELTLRSTPNGVRLFSEPVKEFDMLKKDTKSYGDLTVEKANEILKAYQSDEPLHIKFTWTMFEATSAGFGLNGHNIMHYDMNHNIVNGVHFCSNDIETTKLTAEIIVDKTSAEVFLDHGALSLTIQRRLAEENKSGYYFHGSLTKIDKLEVSPLKSIWND